MAMLTERPPMLLTVADTIRETGLARAYVYRLIADGELPAVRFGRAIRVRRVDLERYVAERLEGGEDA